MAPDKIYIIKGKPELDVCSVCQSENDPNYVDVFFSKKLNQQEKYTYKAENVKYYEFKHPVKGVFKVTDENGISFFPGTFYVYGRDKWYVKEDFKKAYKAENVVFGESIMGLGGIFTYLHAISKLIVLPPNKDGEKKSLSDKYDKVEYVFDDTLLSKYLNPEKAGTVKLDDIGAPFLIFPFGCNADQWEAVRNAVGCQASVVQGPPGTGKTQTILNIIANLILGNKTIQVVSNNNSAVCNVKEKLDEKGYGFLVAHLGGTADDKVPFRDRFYESQKGCYPNLDDWKCGRADIETLRKTLSAISSALPEYFRSRERLASLRDELDEFRQQDSARSNDLAGVDAGTRIPKTPSEKLFRLLFLYEQCMERSGCLTLGIRIRSLLCGMGWTPAGRDVIATAARVRRFHELMSEKDMLERFCSGFKPKYDEYVSLSRKYFNAFLFNRYLDNNKENKRKVYENRDVFRDPARFLKDYPIVLSTAFSATSNIPQRYPFDVLIMDEASQCDVAVGALALNCARSAVIIGDERQLPNVITEQLRKSARQIGEKNKIPAEYTFEEHSFLSSFRAVFKNAPAAFLREHYRCEPRIIGYCNRQFYGGMLIPMTERSECASMDVILSEPDPRPGCNMNIRQAEECLEKILELRKTYGNDIGVIVPYNDQAEEIKRMMKNEDVSLDKIQVSTVHKFQGREMDAIIFCSVDDQIGAFVDDPNLLNVAVSRAKKHFTLIVTKNDLQDGNIRDLVDYVSCTKGEIRTGSVRSVFDILYKPYAEARERFLQDAGVERISEWITENIVNRLLKEIISDEKWSYLGISFQYPLKEVVPDMQGLTAEERSYASNDMTLIDFVLYHLTTRRPVLAIEVDGMSYHKEGTTQWERDRKKDAILSKAGLPLLRLPTNGEREKEMIIKKLGDDSVLTT